MTLTYDPIGHLQTTASGGATTTFLWAGDVLVGEYDASGNILRRYVPGPGTDEPLVWYEGAVTSDRRWLHADTAGSVIGYSDATGASDATYAYDPYGLPDSWTATGAARYRYTGQLMIPEANLYYFKARMYDPANGRFPQTDPVGYQSDINLYAYVGNDPINEWDPSGMDDDDSDDTTLQPPPRRTPPRTRRQHGERRLRHHLDRWKGRHHGRRHIDFRTPRNKCGVYQSSCDDRNSVRKYNG